MKNVYFDNAATTAPFSLLIKNIEKIYSDLYANPSSPHKQGLAAEREIKKAATIIKALLKTNNHNIIFTSGGTESNNMAILGTAISKLKRGNQIITTKVEHASVNETFNHLSKQGFQVIYLDVDSNGQIDCNQLTSSITPKTTLVSFAHVNSETGIIQDINKIANTVKQCNKETIVHVDGVQAFGKLNINLKNIDLYSISAHKIHGFKGIGALLIKKELHIVPIMFGGEQQYGLRPGTENVPSIITFAQAAELNYENINENYVQVSTLKQNLLSIIQSFPFITINGDCKTASPFILNLSFNKINAAILLNQLEMHGIYCSTGSACSSKKPVSRILKNYGLEQNALSSAIRFSFSQFNTMEEVEYCKKVLEQCLPALCKLQ